MTIIYCPCCGSMLRPGASCRKGCAVEPVTGTMADAVAAQGAYLAAQAAKAPAKPAPATVAPKAPARPFRPMWQRRCTCGQCMACIGE
jgi:hypothetical protein